jgi:hypothetical protein
MGSGTTPSVLRGLLVPDPRFKWAAYASASSTLTQAGSRPGVPEAQQDTEMVLEASGSQASSAQLRVKTIRGGHPGIDQARLVWKYEGDGAEHWRGWDPPASLTGFEFVGHSNTAGKWKHPHALTLSDGTIAVAVGEDTQKTVVWTRDPSTGTWTLHEVYDPGAALSYTEPYPCLVQLTSGRLLCLFWTENGTSVQLRTYYSDDAGTTWLPAQKGCLDTALDATAQLPLRRRVVELNDQLALFVHVRDIATPEDQIWQYASNDLGATFDYVDALTGHNRGYPDAVVTDGKILVGYVTNFATTGSSYPPAWRELASAFQAISDANSGDLQTDADVMEWATESGGVFNSGDLAMWVDEDGVVYVMGRDHASTTFEASVRASYDRGATWADLGGGPAPSAGVSTWIGGDTATYPYDFAVCAHRGRAFVAHRFAANPGTADDSLAGFWLGGYTTVCLAQETSTAIGPNTVAGFTVTWLPYDDPANVSGWSATSTGTSALTSDGLHLTTGVGQTEMRTYANITGTLAQGVTALFECQLVTNQWRAEIIVNDGVSVEYEIACLVNAASIALHDSVSGLDVDSVPTTAGVDGKVQILVDVYSGKARMWYRPVGASGDRDWTEVGATAALTDRGSTTVVGHRLRFGQFDSSASYSTMACFSHGAYTEEHLYGQDNYSDLLGRCYTAEPIYVDGGTSIRAVDGPTFRNEDWNIDPVYDYGVENVFPDVAPSPRRRWRSTTDASNVEIAWELGDEATVPMGALVGIYLGDANFPQCELWGQNGAGIWTKVGDIDLRAQVNLKWTRNGRVVRPDTTGGSSVSYYLPTNILAGSRLELVTSGGEPAPAVRKIETNSAGKWESGSSSLQTRILLEEVDGTEATSGTGAALWIKDALAIVPMTATYKRWKLVIPAHTTAEGYFELGALVFGAFFPTGSYLMETAWGRGLEWAYDFEVTEGRTGIRNVRALGPARRAVEVSWVDGVETSPLALSSPNWILGWTSGGAVAVPADMPWSLPGLLDSIHGATTPVVYVGAISVPSSGSAVVTLTDRRMFVYGRVLSETVRVDNVQGGEGKDEILRIGQVRLEEEV